MSCTNKFPEHLINLIKTSKYVHLATSSKDCIPSVSLMNYTYIPSNKTFEHQDNADVDDYIIFATFADTEKFDNIQNNPTVSLLFHDWVTANNLSVRKNSLSQTSTPDPAVNISSSGERPSKLLNLLQELNQSELNEMSATLKGHAQLIDPTTNESTYYKNLLLKTNPDAHVFILGENTYVVKVKIESAKVTDRENNTSIYK